MQSTQRKIKKKYHRHVSHVVISHAVIIFSWQDLTLQNINIVKPALQ